MDNIEKFKTEISPFIDGWQSIDVRSVCLRAHDKWVNLATRIMLSEQPVTVVPVDSTTRLALPELRSFHEVVRIEELDNLLDQLQGGRLSVNDEDIYFGEVISNDVKITPPSFSVTSSRQSIIVVSPDFEFPLTALIASGHSIDNMIYNTAGGLRLEDMDSRLQSLEVPYDGLADLLHSFLHIPKASWGLSVNSALTYVIAPKKIRFGNHNELRSGKLNIEVEVIGFENIDDISIGLIGSSAKQTIDRRSITVNTKNEGWKKEDHILSNRIAVPGITSAVILLRFKNSTVDRITLDDPTLLLDNPRILAYSVYDENLEKVKKYLKGAGSDPGDDFEIGIGLLLHFCGFSVGNYGLITHVQDEIDLIAFSPSSHQILAIECTIKDIEKKISKFSRKIKEFRERLSDFNFIPVICTALENEKVSATDTKRAKEEGITVIAAEEIKALLEMAGSQKQPDEILAYLQNLDREREIRKFLSGNAGINE